MPHSKRCPENLHRDGMVLCLAHFAWWSTLAWWLCDSCCLWKELNCLWKELCSLKFACIQSV